jgi:hypothetical protein
MDPSPQVFFIVDPFLVINDGDKPNIVIAQTMHYVICRSISHMYSFRNTTKKRKGVITHN